MRRLALVLVLAAALTGACGGAEEDARQPARSTTGPTDAQAVFREKLVEKIEAGDYKCYCTGALRARERAERGGPR